MPSRVPPIARIPLARSPLRLLALPVLLVTAGSMLAAVAVLGPMVAPEPLWIALVASGTLVALVGMVIALALLTVRLDVEEAAIRTSWLGGERLYPLVPGPVTRVRLRGANASSLRSRTGWLGWTVGRALLRGEEHVQVIRLAPTSTAILVPTENGRLAIAAASDSDLLEALSRAARARQRLEEVTQAEPPRPEEEAPPAPQPDAEPHVLTGIERAELEERLARARALAVADSAGTAEAGPGGEAVMQPRPAPAPAPEPAPDERRARRWKGGRTGARFVRPPPSVAILLLPMVGAGVVWLTATLGGRLPDPGSDLGRLTSLGLVLAGPATSVGAIMARAWWPRLVGVVVTSGLATAVFVGRALLGPVN